MPFTILLRLALSAALFQQGPPMRHLVWMYNLDRHLSQKRDWYQVAPSQWVEVYPDGRRINFQVVDDHAVVQKVHGALLVDPNRMAAFVPDPRAHGAHAHELYWHDLRKEDPHWHKLGDFTEPR